MQTRHKSKLTGFASDENGAMTAFWLFGFLTLCLVAGLAVDVTNTYRYKERLTLAADAGATAGIVALAAGKSSAEVTSAVLAAVEVNAPLKTVGKTSNATDIVLVHFDPKTRTVVPGSPNAVKVTLHKDETVNNPVKTGLLRLAGWMSSTCTPAVSPITDSRGIARPRT